jgi:type IV secretion system protein VirB4
MRILHGANGHEGANWGVFDNEDDRIDLSTCRHYCYEMRQLIKDGAARPELPVVLSYPFHRIEQAMNGEPFIPVLEEGQNLVKHAYWRDKIDSYIMQIRRKNGLLIFVTPDAKYLYSETDSIQVRRQIDNYKRFKALTDEWVYLSIEHSRLKMRLAREGN